MQSKIGPRSVSAWWKMHDAKSPMACSWRNNDRRCEDGLSMRLSLRKLEHRHEELLMVFVVCGRTRGLSRKIKFYQDNVLNELKTEGLVKLWRKMFRTAHHSGDFYLWWTEFNYFRITSITGSGNNTIVIFQLVISIFHFNNVVVSICCCHPENGSNSRQYLNHSYDKLNVSTYLCFSETSPQV